MKTYKTGHNFI